jgi:RHS repeat-associated protein
VVERHVIQPYGQYTIHNNVWESQDNNVSPVAWQYFHQGLRYDAVTGLYWNRNRDYSPSQQRFIEQDPMGYVDGVNVYGYVMQSPVGLVDPMGLQSAPATQPATQPARDTLSVEIYIVQGVGRKDVAIKHQMAAVRVKEKRTEPICIDGGLDVIIGAVKTEMDRLRTLNDCKNVVVSRVFVMGHTSPDGYMYFGGLQNGNAMVADKSVAGQLKAAGRSFINLLDPMTADSIRALDQEIGGKAEWIFEGCSFAGDASLLNVATTFASIIGRSVFGYNVPVKRQPEDDGTWTVRDATSNYKDLAKLVTISPVSPTTQPTP